MPGGFTRASEAFQGDAQLATGLWTAAAGAVAQANTVDITANNLANVDTLGFKKDQPTFKEYLASVEREKTGADIPRLPIKDKDFYPLDGKDQSFVIMDGTYSNFKQGPLKVTHSPLDIAMDGPGFIEVSTPQGIRYTRQGSLKTATDGRLVTTDGYPVLANLPGGLANQALPVVTDAQSGQGRPNAQGGASTASLSGEDQAAQIASRFINLKERGPVSISESGEIYAGDQLVSKLNVVEFSNLNGLRKVGSGLFENTAKNNIPNNPVRTLIRQGVLEGSNVNPVEEMTNLIKANRLFEQDLKSIKTYSEMMTRESNDIGKL